MGDAPEMSKTDWSKAPIERRRHSSYGSVYGQWLPGLILILIGAIFIAQNYFGSTLQNWWALFILIPALSTLATAYALWREGHADWATGPFIVGLAFVALTAAFLFDLPIAQLWPVALIVIGLGLLVSRERWS